MTKSEQQIKALRDDLNAVRMALETMAVWIAQSNAAPINANDVDRLIRMARNEP